jgi:hypothetical protein
MFSLALFSFIIIIAIAHESSAQQVAYATRNNGSFTFKNPF